MWDPGYKSSKAFKIDKYLDIKNCSYKKCIIDKLVLAFEDEILKQLKPLLMITK